MNTNETPTPTILIGIHLRFFVPDFLVPDYRTGSPYMTATDFLRTGIKGFFSANANAVYGADAISGEPLRPFLLCAHRSALYDNEMRHLIGWVVAAVRPATVREEAFVADAARTANAITKWLIEENPDASFHTEVIIMGDSGKQKTFLPKIKIH